MGVVKPSLIKANAEMPTHWNRKGQKRLSERARRWRDATVRPHANTKRESQAETTWPRIQRVTNTSSTDVYATIMMGRQALAKAYSTTDGNGAMPKVVLSPVVDLLARFRHIGWYWLGGYARFREASLRRVESASSIGTNA